MPLDKLDRRAFLGSVAALSVGAFAGSASAQQRRPNVLMIAVDDLKPLLGCYGDRTVHSPHIDRLAATGLTFDRAYCQQAVCSPTRSSLLTGCRPDTTKVYDLVTHFRTALPDVVTLPQQFKQHGYHAEGMGKLYHGGYDDPRSWSQPTWNPRRRPAAAAGTEDDEYYEREQFRALFAADTKPPEPPRGPAWQAPDVPDTDLHDGQLAEHAVERLKANRDRPFFLGVGFLKPHLPFVAPKRYWDLYDRNALVLPTNRSRPDGAPPYAGHSWGELRSYQGIPQSGPLTDDQARSMLHGYRAAVSFMDAQVGRVLAELDRLGLADNTIVALWGDHGWHLGDHGFWCKHTNYEHADHAPLILRVPGQRHAGAHVRGLVEFVDLYPTICDLCALPKPDTLEGTSMAPLLEQPDRPWKKAAFSQYPRGLQGVGPLMGYALATEHHRFVEWTARRDPQFSECELYDHRVDPEETVNIADRPEQAALVAQLKALRRAGWRAARP